MTFHLGWNTPSDIFHIGWLPDGLTTSRPGGGVPRRSEGKPFDRIAWLRAENARLLNKELEKVQNAVTATKKATKKRKDALVHIEAVRRKIFDVAPDDVVQSIVTIENALKRAINERELARTDRDVIDRNVNIVQMHIARQKRRRDEAAIQLLL